MSKNKVSLPELALAHRYLYYCLQKPVISDQEYDRLEKDALSQVDLHHPLNLPGSEMESSYSDTIKKIAKKLLKNKMSNK